LAHWRRYRIEWPSAANALHIGDAAGVAMRIHRAHARQQLACVIRTRVARTKTHQRSCRQQAAPCHTVPAQRLAQPRIMQLISPAFGFVARYAPPAGQPQWLAS
jgi:sRNA-binding protein